MTYIRTLLALALLAIAAPSLAQPYVTFGAAQIDVSPGERSSSPYLAAGWQFTEHWGAEVSRFDAGHIWGIAVTGTAPLTNKLSLIGKAGVYDVETSAGTVQPLVRIDYGTRAAFGVGVSYALQQHIAIRALLEQVDGKDDLDRVRLFSFGAIFNFN